MKTNGRIENWIVREGNRFIEIRGNIFGFDNPLYPDNSPFGFHVKTEPPYFKSRIVQSAFGNFYLLGEPADKEYEIV